MKNIYLILAFFIAAKTFAQTQAKNIEIGSTKFITLNFPAKVETAKSSIPDLLNVEIAEDNIYLQFLSDESDDIKIPEGNLLVKTSNGYYYSFLLKYNRNPSTLNYFWSESDALRRVANSQSSSFGNTEVNKPTNLYKASTTKTAFDYAAQKVLDSRGYLKIRNVSMSKKILLIFKGVYFDKEKLYFLFTINNDSKIPYDVENYRFEIINKASATTASQSQLLSPVTIFNQKMRLEKDQLYSVVAVFDKFTYDETKDFVFSLSERNGDRNVKYTVSADQLLSAQEIE